MTILVNLIAPAALASFVPRSGTTYTSDANGFINAVVVGNDLIDLLADGCRVVSTISGIGAPGANVTAAEYGSFYEHTTVLTLGASAALPAIAGGAALGVGKLLYTLPAGAQLIAASHLNVAITQTQGHITADTPVVGLGTTIASGAVSVLSGTAAFQNIMAGQAAADCNGTPTVKTTLATASPFGLVTEIGGAKAVYLNAAATWAASGDAAAALSGTVTLNWRTLA